MKIVNYSALYQDEIIEMAYQQYLKEKEYVKEIAREDEANIKDFLRKAILKKTGMICLEADKVCGYFFYSKFRNEKNILQCMVPIWGCAAVGRHREKIMSKLFQMVAKELCKEQKVHFEIKLYAHDEQMIRLFSFLQFGIQCEEGMCYSAIPLERGSNTMIRELDHKEIESRWDEIWELLSALIEHLKQSPVFYPGEEFTEEVYCEYLLSDEVQVYIAEEYNQIIGIIDTCQSGNSFINDEGCCNVGDIFVREKYRGMGVAQDLLNYVATSQHNYHINKLWVEHGTANPNARGFWNKYFHSYSYTMLREI